MLPALIAFSGKAGSGKSYASRYLQERYGYTVIKFAGPLKDMLRSVGLTEEHIEGSLKEVPCGLLCGKTPRFAMQTLGTEWGRNLIDENLWGVLWRSQVEKAMDQGLHVVTDDVRFSNEAERIKSMGGIVIGLETLQPHDVAMHLSEVIDVEPNILIQNNPSVPGGLEATLDFIIAGFVRAAAQKEGATEVAPTSSSN